MKFNWKEIRIDLAAFHEFLVANVSNSDGIVADEQEFEVVEKNPFTQEEKEAVTAYFLSIS